MKTLTLATTGLAIVLALSGGAAAAQQQQFIARDNMGRTLGRAVTDSKGNTTFYNALGQNTGRSTTNSNGTTTTYDNMGRQTGTVTKGR
jgi:hypothetical protein